ncbi:MAG: response regulator [Candidatus Natronoplasma sp.]
MSIKTLFVDDEVALLDQAERFINKKNPEIEVFTATSAQEGLQIFEEKDIDVIVSDYYMPDMDGIEFLKDLRRDGYDTPFIILTGKGREEVAMEAMNHGADGYLKKESDPNTMFDLLVDAIRREYDRWRMERELEDHRKKIEELHHVASKLISCSEEEEAYSLTMEAAEKILNYDYCGIAEAIDGVFRRKAITSNLAPENLSERAIEEGGIDRDTWVNKEKFLMDDINKTDRANPIIQDHDFRSLISLPVDDIGVFQMISKEPGYFDENDLKMSELLISHLSNAIKRIKAQRELERKEKLYRKIFETTGSAMALIDEDMKVSLANEKFHRLFGFFDENIGNIDFLEMVVQQDVPRVEQYCEELKERVNNFSVRFDMQVITQTDEEKHVVVTLGYSDEVNKFVLSLLETPS